MALLEAEGLCASYGPVAVVHGIDFEIPEHDIVVLLGANGAGKTTTLRALSGMLPASGRVDFDGRSLVGLTADRVCALGIAHVPQGRGTFNELTVEENLGVGAYLRNDSAGIKEDIAHWYEVFPVLGQRCGQLAGNLSGGEQQMLAIARALMSRPRLLLLDEPSLGLAPLITKGLFERLTEINETLGTTMFIVEQNANLALGVASYAHVLEAGMIALAGPAADLAADDSVRRAYWGFDVIALINGTFFSWAFFLQLVTNGLSNGAIYAAMALTVVIIYKTTGHLNFAQGELATFSAFGVFVLTSEQNLNVWLAIPIVVVLSMVAGALIERFLVRPVESRSGLAVVIVTLGLFLLLNALTAVIWGTLPRTALAPFPGGIDDQIRVLDGPPRFSIGYDAIGTWVVLAGVVLAVSLLLNRTKLGLGYRAVASNRESAELVGVPVSRMLMLGWALSTGIGALGGVLVSQSSSTLDFNLMGSVLIYGFAAAALGGFDSIRGAVVGGLIVGLAEALLPNMFTFIGSELSLAMALVIILAVLLARPQGLFGTKRVLRV